MSKVKICGIQTPNDAGVAAEAGADYIGLVFVPGRRRRVEPRKAVAIVNAVEESDGRFPQIVGLFADQPLEEVNNIIQSCNLNLVQLCGRESLDYCRQVQGRVIKVVHVEAGESGEEAAGRLAERVQLYRDAGHQVTLDRLIEGVHGGTGQSFDWDIAARLSQLGISFLLAGGLTPSNVADAIATVRPCGVDVSSGVETDGAKDHDKIRAFVHNARAQSAVNERSQAGG